ncbi:unnamed protein product [Auanema sp. JU1783]|nr:unnamed protein product [Auanema sp. JU1783]
MKPDEISCYEQELEYFLQINLYCSEEQLRCWNVSQFLEGLGVIKAVFFIVSSKPETCYEGCMCVSHMKNVEAQLNIYDLSYDKYREQGIDISRVLSSIGIHHTMKDVPVVKTDNLIVDLQLQSAFSVNNPYQKCVQASPAYRFRTSTPIPECLRSSDSISKLHDCSDGEPDENLASVQLTHTQECLNSKNQLSPEDLQEVNQCCEHMLDVLSQRENSSFRSLDDLNLSGYFSFGNSSRSVQVAKNYSENNSLLQMTGFTSVLENFQMKKEKADLSRSFSNGSPVVLPQMKGLDEPFPYERFANGLAYEHDPTRKQMKPLFSAHLADESHCSTRGLESEYSGNMRTPQSSFPRHPHEFSNRYSGTSSASRTMKRQAPTENSETFEDSNKSYDEVFIRRRVSRGKNLEVKGAKVVVTQCNFMGCHHIVSSPRSELRKALLEHVEDHVEDAVPCPTANCPSSEKSFINIREHLRAFHEFDRNCIEALLKRSNRRRMRELTIKCFPNKFF